MKTNLLPQTIKHYLPKVTECLGECAGNIHVARESFAPTNQKKTGLKRRVFDACVAVIRSNGNQVMATNGDYEAGIVTLHTPEKSKKKIKIRSR